MPNLNLTGNPDADELLSKDPNALLIGMLLDQQILIEVAFAGPWHIAQRLGGKLDVARIASMDPDEFAELCAQKPAVHRYPRSMAERIQQLCAALVADWGGDAGRMFAAAKTGAELRKGLESLPGYGSVKAGIFLALLGKQYGVTPPGWREAAGEFGLAGFRSVADITDPESLQRVRAAKQAMKAAAKAAKAGA